MKPLFLALAMLFAANSFAATTVNDTVVVNNPTRVVVISSDSLQKIQIEGSKENPNYKYENQIQLVDSNYVSTSNINPENFTISFGPFNKKKDTDYQSDDFSTTLMFGWNLAPGIPDQADIRPFSSWEIWWRVTDYTFHPWHNRHAFSAGVGLDWRNWRMSDDYRFVEKDDNKSIEIAQYPEGAHPKWSRIKVFSVNFQLAYQYCGKHVGFSLGPVINLNTYGSVKTRYTIDGAKHKDIFKKVHVAPVTVDFMATINFHGGPDFYVKYSPCNMLENGYGPKFKTLSFGIGL